jgi:hypothetical protein
MRATILRALSAFALAVVTVTAVDAQATGQSQTTVFKCPADNGGMLEHAEIARDGMSYRQQVTYIGGAPTVVALAEAKAGEPLRVHTTVDLRNEDDPQTRLFVTIVLRRLTEFAARACSGTLESRQDFMDKVRLHRVQLGLP